MKLRKPFFNVFDEGALVWLLYILRRLPSRTVTDGEMERLCAFSF